MKQLAWLVVLSGSVVAQEAPQGTKFGYSYFTFGLENITYQENFPATQSEVIATNLVLNSGGLYRINDQFDFSIDALATFSPSSADEEWHQGGQLMQTNQFEYTKASTTVLLHYKWQDDWRLVAGPAFSYQTYKRFALRGENGYVNPVFSEDSTWEEKSTDIFLDAGIAYDSGHLYGASPWRVSGRWTAGIPVWSVTENTRFANVQFDDFGFRTSAEASLSYRIMPGLSLAWYVMMGYEKRFESDPQNVMIKDAQGVPQQRQAWLPDADTWTLSSGIQALWNF
ncbi:outer membrane beta-barrel protein [Vibrio navarrensis]|uniref:outer membrane beta-barrel protein n=1 Tax=Vibrio navarrensis TaxID=29495 RepID=UPI0013024E14|nr:outer membrane beta-barrel protein [Vibrio navarrensis]